MPAQYASLVSNIARDIRSKWNGAQAELNRKRIGVEDFQES